MRKWEASAEKDDEFKALVARVGFVFGRAGGEQAFKETEGEIRYADFGKSHVNEVSGLLSLCSVDEGN